MTANDFRELALSFPEAVESAHMHHPDFRVRGKIFATLGYPDSDSAVVKLTPEEQRRFMQSYPKVFRPVKGAWGRRGNANIHLPSEVENCPDALPLPVLASGHLVLKAPTYRSDLFRRRSQQLLSASCLDQGQT